MSYQAVNGCRASCLWAAWRSDISVPMQSTSVSPVAWQDHGSAPCSDRQRKQEQWSQTRSIHPFLFKITPKSVQRDPIRRVMKMQSS